MQSLTQPTLLLKPFADEGDRNSIPVTNTDASNPQRADLTNGFPEITSEDPDDMGLPPERADVNGLGYLTTTYDYFYQAGGTFTYNNTIASAIGGYPLGARLWYDDGNGHTTILKSTKANNTDNFLTTPSYIGTSWVAETPVLSWDNNWTGNNTFSNAITIGSSSFGNNGDIELSPSSSSNNGGIVDFHYNGSSADYSSRLVESSAGRLNYIGVHNSTGTSSTSDTTIAIKGWVNDPSGATNVVHRSGNETITGNKTFSGSVSLGSSATATTPAVSSNTTAVATTAYVNNKFTVVTALPSSPDSNTFYFIKE